MIQTHKIIGYTLLGLFIMQYLFSINIEFLAELQAQEMYKRWSGLFLFLFIMFQWFLTLVRINKKENHSVSLLNIHKWSGAFSPAVFYIHSAHFGYGYLFILGISFFFNFVLGLFNTNFIKSFGQNIFRAWYIAHVLGSVIITIISFLHIYVVFYYK